MSTAEFKTRYLFSASKNEATLAMVLAFVAGTTAATIGAIPGATETIEATKIISGMSSAELLTLITVGALLLAGYCVHTMCTQAAKAAQVVAEQATKSAEQNERAVIALTQIADKMKTMRCLQ